MFLTERKGPMIVSNVQKVVTRADREAGFELKVHPHMLRHSTGFKRANEGQDTRAIQLYLGHKDITHTVRYTELASTRFNGFWEALVVTMGAGVYVLPIYHPRSPRFRQR